MSLEKGINRIGTVSGIVIGAFLALFSFVGCSEFGMFSIPQKIYQDSMLDYLERQYPDFDFGKAYLSGYSPDEVEVYLKEKGIDKKTSENKPSKLVYFYFTTVAVYLLSLIIVSTFFLIGFYIIKFIFYTINWIIKGFRE